MNRHPSGHGGAKRRPSDAGDPDRTLSLDGADDSLLRLLAAATAPVRPGELVGEERAAVAFRAAAVQPSPSLSAIRHRRPRRVRVVIAVQAAVVLLVAAGGIALAAGTGVLPNPIVDVSTSLPVPPRPTPVNTVSTARSSPPGSASHSASEQPPGEQPVSPSLHGLCQAYEANRAHGQSMGASAFAALVAAAGGPDRIGAFCAGIVADHPGESDAEHGPPTASPRTPG